MYILCIFLTFYRKTKRITHFINQVLIETKLIQISFAVLVSTRIAFYGKLILNKIF